MIIHIKAILFSAVVFFLIGSAAMADNKNIKSIFLNPVDKKVKKLEVVHSQIGYRSTLVFYTFAEEKAILKLLINNKTKKFPITATLYTFAGNTSEKGLAKWLNNQHSDGLYVDIPKPVSTDKLSEKCYKIVKATKSGEEQRSFGKFEKYSVEFEFKKVPKLNQFQVDDFKDSTKIYLKAS